MSETNGYISPYIGDGYDEHATILAIPGRWSESNIWYRCITAAEQAEAFHKAKVLGTSNTVQFAELFATKISRWDLKDRSGKVLPIDAKVICGLDPSYFDMLHNYLDGTYQSNERKQTLEESLKNSVAA